MPSSPTAISPIRAHSIAETEWHQQEPFETYKLKIPALCHSIRLLSEQQPLNVENMRGGAYNRVTKLTLPSSVGGERYVLRVPRDNEDPETTAQGVRDQVAINSYVAGLFPVPGIIAYDATNKNAVETPYVIQKLAPGRRLDEVLLEDLPIGDRFQIASAVADIFIRMQSVLIPTSGRLVSAPNIPDRCDDVSTLSTSLVIAPFKIDEGEVHETISSPSVADFIEAILALRCEKCDNKIVLKKWIRLREINQEMKARGFLTCEQPVLWHWDFAPRNILVGHTPSDNFRTNWEVTAVLDWDGLQCVPRVLTREPPVWLWKIDKIPDQAAFDYSFEKPRKPTFRENCIKKHFEYCLSKGGTDIDEYRADAYEHGRWARWLFSFAQLEDAFSFDIEDYKRYDLFIKEWEAYCLEHSTTTIEKPENNPTTAGVSNYLEHTISIAENPTVIPQQLIVKDGINVEISDNGPTIAGDGTESAATDLPTQDEGGKVLYYTSWLSSGFKKVFMWRHSDA